MTINPEHLLLGLTREGEGVAMRVLNGFGAGGPVIREALLVSLPGSSLPGPRIPRAAQPQPGIVAPDPEFRLLMKAAATHAAGEGRTEFGVNDLLTALAGDRRDASALFAHAMREAIKRRAVGDELTG